LEAAWTGSACKTGAIRAVAKSQAAFFILLLLGSYLEQSKSGLDTNIDFHFQIKSYRSPHPRQIRLFIKNVETVPAIRVFGCRKNDQQQAPSWGQLLSSL
jgi:hypothetical protein